MDPKTYRKQALRLRTRAIYERRPELSASFRAIANIYEGLAELAEAEQAKQALAGATKRDAPVPHTRPEPSKSPR